ncbi:MAG: sugar ABC transporter permease [Planctomycetes bacterium]|nr:sugar ABC transporter permease [Planctomycetota bacterium]
MSPDSAPARRRGAGIAWGLVGPVLLLLVAFNVFPLVYNVVLSFTSRELVGDDWRWVGGANYERVFTDPLFAGALRRTALFVLCAVGAELVLGFVLALALVRGFRGKGAVLAVVLVPMMLSPAVMGLFGALVLNGNYGVLNQILGGLGLPQPQWLSDRGLKFWSVVLIDVWMWTPFMTLIALAGLSSIPAQVHEAAAIDRASRWRVFTRITLPMTAPLLGLAVLLRATDALKQFDLVMATTGPNDAATQTLSTLLYQVVFRDGKVGLGAAFACVVLVVVIALATVFTRYLEHLRRAREA